MHIRFNGRLLGSSALSRSFMALALPVLFWPAMAAAQDATLLPPVDVESPKEQTATDLGYAPLTETNVSPLERLRKLAHTNDTASLFEDVAGVSTYKAGGVSNLPVINGLADDRVRIVVDGMVMSSACPNHMNSPLSYVDPTGVGSAKVLAGLTPVSMGGDSIAGTIVIDSPAPLFGTTPDVAVLAASASTFYRSNGDSLTGSVAATAGNDKVSIGYKGSVARAGNYEGGGDDGEVRSTEYKSYNHALTLAARNGDNLVVLEAGQQYLPYEGYPNQYMDMTDNRSTFVNGRYEGSFDWGKLEARAFWQGVDHEMNFLDDKGGMADGGMPMNTSADNAGYEVKATFALKDGGSIRVGNEFNLQRLDDWWPPVAMSMMMGPNTYININGGKRDRLGTFAEWDAKWTKSWSTLLGIRNDTVWTDTGDVQSYGCGMMCMSDNMAAMTFNAADHKHTFVNFDATAIAKYEANETSTFEFGYARKSRAPNLYELYAWGRGSMASRMIGWFGDGNGYVGNLDLDSEIANTLSATADFHSADRSWEAKLTPYYTYVEDYIGVKKIASLSGGFSQFQFVNHNAELYGVNLSGKLGLWKSDAAGEGTLKGTLGYVHGKDLTTDGSLYHIMPLNASLTLEEVYGDWAGHVELKGAARKSSVDDLRNEPETPSYLLVNLGGSYTWQHVRIDLGVDNLFDTAYDDPLGGLSLGDYMATGVLRPLPGMGRSLNVGLTLSL
ncbi:TonB-dependent receptor plug domain-containing protein [Parvibaculum sedimenti]|uniref:TonB-dependent receptor plug domain-containing protein n=1 Tax=Parvibaculum sedimenti TaxID=2608632 RepID=A0A6N6VJG0_9HYPH|nr:TonB-dependent receptor [Parvibaculum sedimenti]KAB7741227.1 TonB-dependent receptor plug domain-containing protein [Parvibaculum sedimenti]